MTPYAATKVFEGRLVSDMAIVSGLVDQIPEKLGDRWVRCHEIVRAVHAFASDKVGSFRWRVVDGLYIEGVGRVCHSWLRHETRDVVLDCYAVARLPPVVLVDTSFLRHSYVESDIRVDVRTHIVDELVVLLRREVTP